MSNNEYILSPFISLDGTDHQGVRAEVKVITGHALVSSKKNPRNRNTPMLQFFFDTPTSRYPTGAWVNEEDDPELSQFLNDALSNNEAVDFRIEIQRKNNVDRKKPFAEISPKEDTKAALENTFRYIVAARKDPSEEWIVGKNMVTSFKQDPVYGRAPKASDEEDEVGARNNPTPAANNSFNDSPYSLFLDNGDVNPNSFALMTPVEVNIFIRKHFNQHLGADIPFNQEEVDEIVKLTLTVVGSVQKYMTKNNTVEPTKYSYKVAKEIVEGVMEHYYPIRVTENDFKKEIREYFKMVFLMSKKIFDSSKDFLESYSQ